MAQTEKRDVIITLNNGQALNSIKEMESAQRKLNAEFRKATAGDERKRLADELKKVNTELAKQKEHVRAAQGGWDKLNGTLQKLGGAAIAMVGLQAITQQFSNIIGHSAKLADAMSDVQKTTGMTAAQVKQLDTVLKGMDTRTSRTKLLELASAAGKIGKTGVEDVRRFVDEADKIQVALGEDLGQDAIIAIGKLANTFKTSMLNIASAINTAGASSEASEAYLVDFAARLAGIADTAKIGAGDIIGYGATLDSLGLQAEMSSTALNTFFMEFLKNTENFGAAAGMAEGELSKLIGTEGTNAGFVAFLTKMKEMNPEADKFLKQLEALGIDGARGSQVFLALSNNIEKLGQQQNIANDAFNKGTSILDEFNVKNNNFAANLEKIQKTLAGTFMSSGLVKGIESIVNWGAKLVATPVSEKMNEERVQLNVLVGKIMEYNVGSTERVRLIKELQQQYPDFIKNIDAEKVSNQDLTKALKETNEQMVNKIIIQRKAEAIAEQAEKTADNLEKKLQAEADLREQLQKQAEKYNVDLTKYGTLQEKVNAVLAETAKQQGELVRGRLLDEATNDNYKLADAVKSLNFNSAAYNKSLKDQNALTQERADLMKQLGIEDAAPSLSGGGQVPTLGGSTPESPDAQAAKAAEKALADFYANTAKLREEWRNIQVDAIDNVYEQERAQIDSTWEKEKARVRATEADAIAKAELLDALDMQRDQKLAKLNADYEKDRAEALERQQADMDKAMDGLVQADKDARYRMLEVAYNISEEGTQERYQAELDLLMWAMDEELSNTVYTEEEKLRIREEYMKSRADLEAQYQEAQKEQDQEYLAYVEQQGGTVAQAFQGAMAAVNQLADQADQQALDRLGEVADKRQDELDRMLAQGVITQKQYDDRSIAIQNERERKERDIMRKQWSRNKASSLVNAIINTALGVTQALGSSPPPANFIAAAFVGAAGAAEIGTISGTVNPYYKGGRTKVKDTEGNVWNAVMTGSLADGGRYSTASLGIVGERGEELVVPNNILNHPDYADAINHIERGIAGGYTMSSSGGSAYGIANATRSTTAQNNSGDTAAALHMAATALEQNTAVMQALMKNGVRGRWEWDDFEQGLLDQERAYGSHIMSSSTGRRPGDRL